MSFSKIFSKKIFAFSKKYLFLKNILRIFAVLKRFNGDLFFNQWNG